MPPTPVGLRTPPDGLLVGRLPGQLCSAVTLPCGPLDHAPRKGVRRLYPGILSVEVDLLCHISGRKGREFEMNSEKPSQVGTIAADWFLSIFFSTVCPWRACPLLLKSWPRRVGAPAPAGFLLAPGWAWPLLEVLDRDHRPWSSSLLGRWLWPGAVCSGRVPASFRKETSPYVALTPPGGPHSQKRSHGP